MTVVNILIAAVVLGLMGLLFGLLLMGTEKVFAIPADEKRDAVRAARTAAAAAIPAAMAVLMRLLAAKRP